MNSSRKYTAWLVGLLVLPAKTFAFGAILQYEGEVDDRVAYFADLRYVLNKTPPGQTGGKIEIRELAVTAVCRLGAHRRDPAI